MSTLGKVFLVVCLLAAGGYAYLGVQDWRGRQTIDAAGLRHQLLLVGFPLEGGPDTFPARVTPTAEGYNDYVSTEIPFKGIIGPGGVPSTVVSPELLYVYFANAGAADAAATLAGNDPVASQEAEVKRAYSRIKDVLGKADGAAAKAAAAAPYLLYQPETLEGRAEVQKLIAAQNGNELAHLIDLQFHRVIPKVVEAGPINRELWDQIPERLKKLEADKKAAEDAAATAAKEAENLAATNPAAAAVKQAEADDKRAEAGARAQEIERRTLRPAKDATELRDRTAHLLAHLDTSAAWQKRTMMVVGLRQYVHALAEQAIRFTEMAARVAQLTADDQARFVAQYALLRSQAIERTYTVREWAEVRAQLEEQVRKDKDFVAQRQTQLAALKTRLAQIKAEVDAQLARQTLAEAELYQIQLNIAKTLEEVYKRDADLAQKERAKYQTGGP